jgi:hypothetical protein
MTWTLEKLEQIPEVYRDFMWTLKPVLDSRDPNEILKTEGVSFGRIFGQLSDRYDYEVEQVRQVAQNLRQRGLVAVDRLGIYTPTPEGERLILALGEAGEEVGHRVPPLPEF